MAAMSKTEQATGRTANVRDLSVSDDWSLLHLKGVIFDTIESVGTPNRWPQDTSWNSLALDLLDDFRMFIASAKRASGAGDDQSFTQAWTSQVSAAGSDSPVVIESPTVLHQQRGACKECLCFHPLVSRHDRQDDTQLVQKRDSGKFPSRDGLFISRSSARRKPQDVSNQERKPWHCVSWRGKRRQDLHSVWRRCSVRSARRRKILAFGLGCFCGQYNERK